MKMIINRPDKKLEICCYSVESALIAEKSGADRVELCDNYSEGGTTPSFASIKLAVDSLKIPVNVIVRPRGGDFLYTDVEFEIIKQDVLKIKELNANGVVIGFLMKDGNIDLDKTKEIVKLAKPMEITFHRAFDMCKNPLLALEQLIELGVTRILTSGAENKAMDGSRLIADLIKKAKNKIIIMPGSGVNAENIKELSEKSDAVEFHSSAKSFEKSRMSYFNKNISMGGEANIDEFSKISVDSLQIRNMVNILDKKCRTSFLTCLF